MPKGRSKVHHKGRGKKYLTEEEIRIAEEKKMKEKEWKRKKGIQVESESEEEEEAKAVSQGLPGELPPSDSSEGEEEWSEEESDSELKKPKPKGVDGVIEVENPNRVVKKSIKAKDIDINAKVELSRREREEIERQRASQAYQKLQQAGKTEEARRDLARLALIRQQREEAAQKRAKAVATQSKAKS